MDRTTFKLVQRFRLLMARAQNQRAMGTIDHALKGEWIAVHAQVKDLNLYPDSLVPANWPVLQVVSYPRSGNTLTIHLLTDLFQTNYLQDFGSYLAFHRGTFRLLDQTMPTIVKGHALRPQHTAERVAYIVRDGRDALLSYAHYTHAAGHHDLTAREDMARCVDFLCSTYRGPEEMNWIEHVNRAIALQRVNPNFRVFRYEDIRSGDRETLRALVSFANLGDSMRSDAALDAALAKADTWRASVTAPSWVPETRYPETSFLFHWQDNRTQSNWRASFTDEAMDRFMAHGAAASLEALGYPL
jgi:hypothetical protein